MTAFYTSILYSYYYPLLSRYARRRGVNEPTANAIALQVLWDQYFIHSAGDVKAIRQLLKQAVADYCMYKKQLAIFDRPAISIPPKPTNSNFLHQLLNETIL